MISVMFSGGALLEHIPRYEGVLICGSIGCALAMKIGGKAKAHEISKTQKWFRKFHPVKEILK